MGGPKQASLPGRAKGLEGHFCAFGEVSIFGESGQKGAVGQVGRRCSGATYAHFESKFWAKKRPPFEGSFWGGLLADYLL